MEDREIIKALECCPKANNYDDCKKLQCPLYRECKIQHKSVEEVVAPYALDLINRLQAENERLNKEVDRLSQVVLYNDSVTEMKVEEAKAEAYKEFAELLIDKFSCGNDELYHEWYIHCKIKDLLNEVVGDNNEMPNT